MSTDPARAERRRALPGAPSLHRHGRPFPQSGNMALLLSDLCASDPASCSHLVQKTRINSGRFHAAKHYLTIEYVIFETFVAATCANG